MNKAIYFKGHNCGVCIVLYPKIKTHFAEKFPLIEFQTVQVEDEPEIAAQNSVFTIPTLLVFIDDKEYFRFVRNFSTLEIDEKLVRVYKLKFED